MESARKLPEPSEKVVTSREACEGVVARYVFQAVWPTDLHDPTRNLLQRLAVDISSKCGKDLETVSLDDLYRAQSKLREMSGLVGLNKVPFGTAKVVKETIDEMSHYFKLVSDAYLLGNLFFGNFGPLIRRLGVELSGAPLARAAGVWVAGQIITELYCDPEIAEKPVQQRMVQSFHPIFDNFNIEQLRELSFFIGIDPRMSWSEEKIRNEVLNTV